MTAGCSDIGHTHSSLVHCRCPGSGGVGRERAELHACLLPFSSFSWSPSGTDQGPLYHPQRLPRAQAYPIAVDAGGIAEGTVTAAACPTRLTHTLSHGAASPVCSEREEGRIEPHSYVQFKMATTRVGPWELYGRSWPSVPWNLLPSVLPSTEGRATIPKHKSIPVFSLFKTL